MGGQGEGKTGRRRGKGGKEVEGREDGKGDGKTKEKRERKEKNSIG